MVFGEECCVGDKIQGTLSSTAKGKEKGHHHTVISSFLRKDTSTKTQPGKKDHSSGEKVQDPELLPGEVKDFGRGDSHLVHHAVLDGDHGNARRDAVNSAATVRSGFRRRSSIFFQRSFVSVTKGEGGELEVRAGEVDGPHQEAMPGEGHLANLK